MDLVLYLFYVQLTPWVHKVAKSRMLRKVRLVFRKPVLYQKKKKRKKLVYKSVCVSISTLLQNVKYSKNNLAGIALSSF